MVLGSQEKVYGLGFRLRKRLAADRDMMTGIKIIGEVEITTPVRTAATDLDRLDVSSEG